MQTCLSDFINWLSGLEASDVAALAASVAATFTAYQAMLLRRHNRLSVKPHLSTWTRTDDANKEFKIYFILSNNGLGPAIIKDFVVYFDNEKLGDNMDTQALKSEIEKKAAQEKGIIKSTVSVLGIDSAFPVGEKEVLFLIHVPMYMGFDKSKFESFVNRFDLKINYNSVYGEVMKPLSTRDE